MSAETREKDILDTITDLLAAMALALFITLMAVQAAMVIGEDPRYDDPHHPPAPVVAYNGEPSFIPPRTTPAGGVTPAPSFSGAGQVSK